MRKPYKHRQSWPKELSIMALKIILILLTLTIALIGVSVSKDLSRKITIVLVILSIGLAVTSIVLEWRSENVKAKDKAKQATSGKLEDVTGSRISQGARLVNVEIGSSGAIFAHIMNPDLNSFRLLGGFNFANEFKFPIWFAIDGTKIRVSADIRDSEGSMIAKMKDNEWQINEGNTFDRNYTDDALEVINNNDEVVLQVELLNDRVRIQGKFFDKEGLVWMIYGVPGKSGGAISRSKPGSVLTKIKISRIFLYPSSLHFGERIGP